MKRLLLISMIAGTLLNATWAGQLLKEKEFINSVGMKMVRIEAGEFLMGSKAGKIAEGVDIDESPAHKVIISNDFYMAATEVTNAQFEKFRPGFRKTSGKPNMLSNGNDEAVIHVSWRDAAEFCQWLSEKEGRVYRLPTEAEWEYACRAGTTTRYNTGDNLPKIYHKNQKIVVGPRKVSLKIAQTPANGWGLYDMHGNVEEWCFDWYGPYVSASQVDPVGYEIGEFRVTRGGSHSTLVRYLQSANRMAAIPQDRHWLLGFRVVVGPMRQSTALAQSEPKLCFQKVSQKRYDWPVKADMSKPYFSSPIEYVHEPEVVESVPFYTHNHCPAITYCDNGDLLAVWFSVALERNREKGREMTILASRLREGKDKWDMPSEFYKVPDRNMTGSALIKDSRGRLYFFNGVSVADHWKVNNALVMKTSEDNGAIWTKTRIINQQRGISSQPIGSGYCNRWGWLVFASDWPWGKKDGGSGLWISKDRGESWSLSEAPIAGIHASNVDIKGGKFYALGRYLSKKSPMPASISTDEGKSWKYIDTSLPGIGGGQRLVLRRLTEGPLLLVSFTDTKNAMKKGKAKGVIVRDKSGNKQRVYGMYAALSYDEGKSWKITKLLTPTQEPKKYNGGAWTGEFTADATHAEPAGYLAGIQTPDGLFHLISSALHYQFNLAWLQEPMEAN